MKSAGKRSKREKKGGSGKNDNAKKVTEKLEVLLVKEESKESKDKETKEKAEEKAISPLPSFSVPSFLFLFLKKIALPLIGSFLFCFVFTRDFI